MKQRVLTPQEYAALGYVQRDDFDPTMFNIRPDKPLSEPFFAFPVYRADTKEEFAIDLAVGTIKVAAAATTGGIIAAGRTALGYTMSVLSDD